MQKQQITI